MSLDLGYPNFEAVVRLPDGNIKIFSVRWPTPAQLEFPIVQEAHKVKAEFVGDSRLRFGTVTVARVLVQNGTAYYE